MTALGYTRLSEDGLSIPDQKDLIRDYCERHAHDLERIYDDGTHASGYATDERPAYRELRDRVRDGDVSLVVVRDTDRIGRDFDERMRFVLDCRETGTQLHSTERGQHDLSDPYSVVVETAQAASADVAKRAEIERAKQATERRIDDGCYHGRPPFGLQFAADNCHLERDPDEWQTIEAVIAARENGQSVVAVAEQTGLSTATVSRIHNRGRLWYDAKLAEYGAE